MKTHNTLMFGEFREDWWVCNNNTIAVRFNIDMSHIMGLNNVKITDKEGLKPFEGEWKEVYEREYCFSDIEAHKVELSGRECTTYISAQDYYQVKAILLNTKKVYIRSDGLVKFSSIIGDAYVAAIEAGDIKDTSEEVDRVTMDDIKNAVFILWAEDDRVNMLEEVLQ